MRSTTPRSGRELKSSAQLLAKQMALAMRREFSDDFKAMALTRAKGRCERCGGSRHAGLQYHHVGHPSDSSLFNCMLLCRTLPRGRTPTKKDARGAVALVVAPQVVWGSFRLHGWSGGAARRRQSRIFRIRENTF